MNQNKGDVVDENFKSKFLTDAEVAKQRLDAVSPSMCLAKWKQVSLHLTNGMNNSCYHPPLHQVDASKLADDPSALHNTDHKKQMRKLMLEGLRPEECGYCWAMEDNGKLSDRHYRSGEPWAIKDYDSIIASDWDTPVLPSYVEAFWKWWPDLYPELEHFRMTGGEPLMDKNTYRVFDHVLNNPSPKLHLNVTSNFSVDEKLWQKYLGYIKMLCEGEKIEHFMQFVSLDAFGNRAEYIRNGLDFNLLWDRVNQFLTEVPERSSITFIVTMNNLSVTSLKELFVGIHGLRQIYSNTYQRVWFDTPVLHNPAWQSLQIMPESYCQELERLYIWMMHQVETEDTRFKGFKDYEIHRLDRDIAWMRDGLKMDSEKRNSIKADFYRFFSEHDRRRDTDFLKTFPEMSEWWQECKYLADNT